MASRYWLGVNNNLTDTNNWSATEGGTGGATVPGASDSAWFTRNTTFPSTNLSGIATLTNLYVYKGFGEGATQRMLGTASTPLAVSVTGEVVIQNPGLQLIHLAGTIAKLTAMELGAAQLKISSGEATTLILPSTGTFDVATDVKVTNFYTSGCGGVLRECPTSPPSLVAFIGSGANVEIQRKLLRATIAGGVQLTESGHTNVAGSEIVVAPGGALVLAQRGGQIGNASTELVQVMTGGSLLSRPAYPFTFTASVHKHAGARVDIPAATVTAVPTIVPLGGMAS